VDIRLSCEAGVVDAEGQETKEGKVVGILLDEGGMLGRGVEEGMLALLGC